MNRLQTAWLARSNHPLFQRLWRSRVVLVTVPLVTGIIYGVRTVGWLQSMELATYDAQIRLRPSQGKDPRILIVAIDEQDLQAIEQWPLPDCVLATALNTIKQHGPVTIGLDLYRDLPIASLNRFCSSEAKRKGTSELYKVFRSTPTLVGIERRSANPAVLIPVKPPPILDPDTQIGVNNFVPDLDNRIRRGLIYFDEGKASDSERRPSFSLNLALNYLETKNIAPEVGSEFLRLKNHSFVPFESQDGGYNHADADSYQILINYRNLGDSFDRVSLRDVLANRVPDAKIRGRVVLIGSAATSLNDLFLVPQSQDFSGGPRLIPGVEIHAHVVSQILSTVLDRRPGIQVLPDSLEMLWVLGWTIFAALLYGQPRKVQPLFKQWFRGRESRLILGLLGFGGIVQGAISVGWWLPVVPPMLGILGTVLGITAYQAWSAAELRKTFGRYLTAEVVYQLLDTPQGLRMGGDRRTVTMLMADLRGFSSASERQPPEQVLMFLNQYLEIMTDVINRYQGTIDEFMGDGILVLFGAPTTREDDPDRAVACAIAMQQAMTAVNQHAPLLGLTQIEMGVGVHTGEVVVGNIGSLKRAKYGIVGSHMNLTSRIESYTVGGQVLISEATCQLVRSRVETNGLMQIETKGFQQAITLYDVQGLTGRFQLSLPQKETTVDALAIPIPVQFAVIEGKHIQPTQTPGVLHQVSAQGARLESPVAIAVFSNLKLNLNSSDRTADFYAKVTAEVGEKTEGDLRTYQVRFTFVPPEVLDELESFRSI